MESKDFRNLMESAQDILNESKKKIVPHTPEHKEFREKLAGDDAKRKFDNMTPKQRKAYHQEWMDIQWDSHTHGVEESLSDKTLRSYINKADPEVARVKYGDAKHTPKTNRRARGVNKARARLLAPDELAISPERIADTRKNIEKFLNRKRK